MKHERLEIIGKTTDGRSVVKGIFKFFDTTGIPLFIIFDLCEQHNWIPSWINFYQEASGRGWTHKTIINRLKDGITDVYGTEFCDTVISNLNKVFMPV